MPTLTKDGIDLDTADLEDLGRISLPTDLKSMAKEEPCKHYLYYLMLLTKLQDLINSNSALAEDDDLRGAFLKFTSEVIGYKALTEAKDENAIINCKETGAIDVAFLRIKQRVIEINKLHEKVQDIVAQIDRIDL